uniref:Hydrocephalus-inducing protein homolog n=1 Tax=Cacopsylla melanoneura TaxID=428564 RepID=A0A8D9B0J2_9HEMI
MERDVELWLVAVFESIQKSLCLVKAHVTGIKFMLDRDLISFNPTQRTCVTHERLILINDGDVGSRFEWTINQRPSYFKISPTRGYSKPNSVVHFNVEFSPASQILYLSCKAYCKLEKYTTLELTMSGSCVTMPKSHEVIEFSIPVRTTATRTITKAYPPAGTLEPYLTGHYYSGVNHLYGAETHPTTLAYEITYAPLVMTPQYGYHFGYLKLRGDQNKHYMFRMVGKSLPPLPNETIRSSLPALKPYVQPLVATNWLAYNQLFVCYYNFIPEGSQGKKENYLSAEMREHILLPALTERTIELHLTPYRLGILHIKVFLKNEESQEYQWWDLTYDIVRPEDEIGPIELTTFARRSVEYSILVDNPMIDSTVFTGTSRHPDLTVQDSLIVPGRQKGKLKVKYYSFLPCDQQVGSIDVDSPELGHSTYLFNLTALPSPSEKELKFTAELGKNVTQTIELENLSSKPKTEFTLNVSHQDFFVDKSVNIVQGIKTSITVMYEPSSLVSCETTLIAKSPHAGVYTFSLVGQVIPPMPQGPFNVHYGELVSLPFKNIFTEARIFRYVVDNPIFTLRTTSEQLKNKKVRRSHNLKRHLNFSSA